jgi:hypothetical protein
VDNDLFPLFWADWLRAHCWIIVVLVVERHHRDHAAAMFLVIEQLRPAVTPHAHAPHKAASPIVAESDTVLILQQEWAVDLTFMQGCGN